MLRKCTANLFFVYFGWYRRRHPRAKMLNTFLSRWKWLRQLYYDRCQKVLPEDVGKPVSNVGRIILANTVACFPISRARRSNRH